MKGIAFAVLLAIALFSVASVHPAAAQSDAAAALKSRYEALFQEGKYAEAIPLAEKALELTGAGSGGDDADAAEILNDLAVLHYLKGSYAEAETYYKRAVALFQETVGPEHPDTADSMVSLGMLYEALGRYADAEPLYRRGIAVFEKAFGPDAPRLSRALSTLGSLHVHQGRYGEAEALFRRALAINEKVLGPEHPNVGIDLNNLALALKLQGRVAEAVPQLKRSLDVAQKTLGPEHPDLATTINNLADIYRVEGRYDEAEPLYKRSLLIREKALGPAHADVANSLNDLAVLYVEEKRFKEAEPLYQRAKAIYEGAFGPDHPLVANTINSLAHLYQQEGRLVDTIDLYKRALAIREKALGPEHPDVAQSLNNLAAAFRDGNQLEKAERLFQGALAIKEKRLGPEHPDTAITLNNLAGVYAAQGRVDEAETLYKRALGIDEKIYGAEHPKVAVPLNNLAGLYLKQSRWQEAADAWRRSTRILTTRARRSADTLGGAQTGKMENEALRSGWQFWGLAKTLYRVGEIDGSQKEGLAQEVFEGAQWIAGTEAGLSLAQMSARGATGDPALAALVRERQDLVVEWQARDAAQTAALSEPPEKRAAEAEKANATRLAEIDARLAAIDQRLGERFPEYTALANPAPRTIAEVQADLHDDEALVLFLDTPPGKPTPEETFIWVVSKTGVRWARSEFGISQLRRRVAALRCGLDDGAWAGTVRDQCLALLGLDKARAWRAGQPMPFDVGKAYELYKGLFGEVEDAIRGKALLLVPTGALTSLPFQVLVTAPPHGSDIGEAAWLILDHALTVLPSVASLAALRRNAEASAAAEPFIGFGNPVLARQCRAPVIPEKCPDEEIEIAAAESDATRSMELAETIGDFFRGGLADVAAVKSRLCPLPDTAHELACVAKSLGAGADMLVLGKDMTETAVKSLPIARYRVVHFATHGLLAGETSQVSKGLVEPALVFSPPDTATAADDGLLTASEVAGLKLDADWVVMSACNTAAGVEPGAEALSGLARAFFYAGARALLVSHWPVNSYGATMLTSRTFAEMKADPGLGRSEAFRRAMLALMSNKDRPRDAHPSVWAPFVVVGEGGVEAAGAAAAR